MSSNKWRLPESLLLLSFCLLALYLGGVPLPLPAFVLPERVYVALPRSAGVEALREAAGSAREAWALLPDSLERLPSPKAGEDRWEAALASLPERPVFDALQAELESPAFPALRRARLVLGFTPVASELDRLEAIAKRRGIPLSIGLPPAVVGPGLSSFSWRAGNTGGAFAFELFFSPEAATRQVGIVVSALRKGARASDTSALWKGMGSDLPSDRVLRLSTDRDNLDSISVSLSSPQGSSKIKLLAGGDAEKTPHVLVIDEGGRGSSFIDSLYPARHVRPGELASIDPADWELVVDDGVPISRFDTPFSTRLAEDARMGRTSLLFAADSADFGRRGDNPAIEGILPVTLLPPSLKDLPDMAILILLDYSGSMFGGKLSLAKVTSLELLRGLKPSDRVGLLLFSDKRRWIWSFARNSEIEAAPVLDPVEAEGGTELGPALTEGMDRLAATGPGEKHIVVISDGVSRPADFSALAARAREKGITISTMGVGEDMNRPLLERLAAEGGGSFRIVASADEIPALIFEDRKSQARPRFAEGRIPVLDPAGTRVATIGGMAQYATKAGASVLYANEVGDPLLSELESGRRAVMLFASDLHGGFTKDFFAKPSVVATMRERLDSLFADRPRDIAVLETSRESRVTFKSDSLVAPALLVSRAGSRPLNFAFSRRDGETWEASVVLPSLGRWRASLVDRGTGLASFDLPVNEGIVGVDLPSARKVAEHRASAFRLVSEGRLWLLLFFMAALGGTLAMRRRR